MPELVPAAPGSPEWLAARRAGVTATDIVTILGLSSWDSPYSLYWRKLGQVPEVKANDRMRLGAYLEGYIESCWVDEHKKFPGETGLYRNSDRPWQMATPDALYGDEPCEWKSWADAARGMWDDGPPASVRAQVLWQMDVMDVAVGHVGVVFLPSGEFRSYVIGHLGICQPGAWEALDCEACQNLHLMRAAGEEFMARLRLELPAPDPDASAATLAAVRARFTRQPDKTAEIDGDMLGQWLDAKDQSAHWDRIARGCEIQLREQAGEASVLTVDGQPVARRYVVEQNVKAHTRRMDYLKRIKGADDDA